jgi:hypothetical protein
LPITNFLKLIAVQKVRNKIQGCNFMHRINAQKNIQTVSATPRDKQQIATLEKLALKIEKNPETVDLSILKDITLFKLEQLSAEFERIDHSLAADFKQYIQDIKSGATIGAVVHMEGLLDNSSLNGEQKEKVRSAYKLLKAYDDKKDDTGYHQ